MLGCVDCGFDGESWGEAEEGDVQRSGVPERSAIREEAVNCCVDLGVLPIRVGGVPRYGWGMVDYNIRLPRPSEI